MERCRILFSGSGGQGVITASIILAEAAVIFEGLNAVQSQVYGPEARGGATRSDVIIADTDIRYPKVTQPNVLISLTQKAYDKYSGSIRPGGLLLTDSHFVKQASKVDARQVSLGMYKSVMGEIGKPIVYNISVLGAMLALTGLITKDSIIKVLEYKIPRGFLEMNKKAFDIGMALGGRVTESNA